MTDLGTLGGLTSSAHGINSAGQIVGESQTAQGETHAFLWNKAGGMVGLGVLPGFTDSGAHDINNLGQVVGYCALAGAANRGFVWNSAAGMKPSVRCRAASVAMLSGSTIWAKL
jgi:probable HAF family extracellular repeat protein